MFTYRMLIQTVDNQTVVVDGYQANGRLSKRAAEQIVREELADPKHVSATIFSQNGKKIYSR